MRGSGHCDVAGHYLAHAQTAMDVSEHQRAQKVAAAESTGVLCTQCESRTVLHIPSMAIMFGSFHSLLTGTQRHEVALLMACEGARGRHETYIDADLNPGRETASLCS